jgi:hypothetical protein
MCLVDSHEEENEKIIRNKRATIRRGKKRVMMEETLGFFSMLLI